MSSGMLWPRDAIISLCEMAQTLTILWDPRDATYVRHKLRQKCFTDLTNLTGGNLIIMIFDSLSLLNNDDHGHKNSKSKSIQDQEGTNIGLSRVNHTPAAGPDLGHLTPKTGRKRDRKSARVNRALDDL